MIRHECSLPLMHGVAGNYFCCMRLLSCKVAMPDWVSTSVGSTIYAVA